MKKIGDKSVIEEVVHTFDLHSDEHARVALSVFTFSAMTDKGMKSIISLHGVERLMEAIEEFNNDREVCENGFNALHYLVELRVVDKIVMKYGVSCILSAMRTFVEEKMLQLYALLTLQGLEDVNGIGKIIGEEGGVAAIVNVWKHHSNELDIVRVGAHVLRTVIEDDEENVDELVDLDAVQTILEVLEFCSEDEEVMTVVYDLICVVAKNPEAKNRLVKEDIPNTLIFTITSNDGENKNATLFSNAVRAFMSLILPINEEADVQEIVTTVLNAFKVVLESKSVNVDEACLGCLEALVSLCEKDECKKIALENDVIHYIELTLARSQRNIKMIQSAMNLLKTLCEDETVLETGVTEEVVNSVMEVMKNYPQSSVILCLTLDWLLAVSAHVSAREVLAKEEILKSVVAALQACSFNRTIVDDSCLIFANLSDIDDAVIVMNKLDVLSIVEEMNKTNGSAKTDSAVIELKKVLKKSHRHHHHHRSEKTEGENGEERKRHRSHRHHSHRSRSKKPEDVVVEEGEGEEGAVEEEEKKQRHHSHRHHSHRSRSKRAEGGEGVEEKKKHRHHSHRSRSKRAEGGDGSERKKHRRHHSRSEKPVVEPQVVEGENPSEDVQQL